LQSAIVKEECSMPFNKIILLALMVLAVGAGAAYAATRDNSPAPAGSIGPTGVVDVSGPCDEAEHANDPRCTGAQVPDNDNDEAAEDRKDDDAAGEDISGPCDEAEHANDPRCSGGQVGDDDNSGPSSNRGASVDDDNEADDNSGPSDNSGSGHSGSGGGDDDSGSDDGGHSGPGGGGDDD
jgi:uncharacterized membrane protein YgcG